VASGGQKEALRKYDLKKRLYLGPTSLDTSLALLLANISQVPS
jgi:tRNA G10  N-methylase Trm11